MRNVGSGNVGATNVMRSAGRGAGRSRSGSTSPRALSPWRSRSARARATAGSRRLAPRRRWSGTCSRSGSASAAARAWRPAPARFALVPVAALVALPVFAAGRGHDALRVARLDARSVEPRARHARLPRSRPRRDLGRGDGRAHRLEHRANLQRIARGHRAAARRARRAASVRLAVLGGGSWGTALAAHLARAGHDVAAVGARRPRSRDEINERRENQALPARRRAARGARAPRPTSTRRSRAPKPSSSPSPREFCRDVYRRVGAAARAGRAARLGHQGARDRHAAAHERGRRGGGARPSARRALGPVVRARGGAGRSRRRSWWRRTTMAVAEGVQRALVDAAPSAPTRATTWWASSWRARSRT